MRTTRCNEKRTSCCEQYLRHSHPRNPCYSVPFEVDWQTQGAWPMIDGDTRALDLGDEPRGSATRDGSHPGCLRTTVLPLRLDQGPSPRRRGHPGHRPAHRLCRPADPGQGPGTPLQQLSPRPEPRRLVLPGRRTDPLGPDRLLDPRWLAHLLDRRRDRRAAGWPQDQGQGVLSRRRSLIQGPPHPMLRPEVDRSDGPGPGALESAGLGLAVLDHLELARGLRPTEPPQDRDRLDAADDHAGPPLVAREGTDPGARWWLRGGQAGARLSASSGGPDLSLAARCGPV